MSQPFDFFGRESLAACLDSRAVDLDSPVAAAAGFASLLLPLLSLDDLPLPSLDVEDAAVSVCGLSASAAFL